MTGHVTADELRAELKQVETDLERLRRTAAEIRADVGEAEDPTDRGSLIQAADEQDSLAEALSARRDDLLRRLADLER
jgi:cell division septum initiation protein DivIVA